VPSPIQIEDATLRMLDQLYEIERQSFKEEAFSKQQIRYLLTDFNAISLVAKIQGQIVGFIIGAIEAVQEQLVGHILTIDVATQYRRVGVAERLMRELEGMYRQKGIGEVLLEVRESNDAARALYGKLGYNVVSRLENYYGNAHGLYLKKMLK